jgi:bifunctional non-homologous end joining protein LigD
MPAAARQKNPVKQELEVEGRCVTVSNLDKVLYPDNGFTKAQVIDYYIRVAQYLLPHFHDRPVTLKRFPDGVRGDAFYEKDAPGFAPDWITTFPVPRKNGGTDIQYILINDLSTLVWCANAASLELHPFLHCAPNISRPTAIVFDLDPGEGMHLKECADVAFLVRQFLSDRGLKSFPKVSGSKGLQIYVPLNSGATYDVTRPFARALADSLAKQHPKLIVAEMAKILRPGKVFIDWSQNSDYKTTAGVYSLRAKVGRPFVSLPVTWEELGRDPDKLQWQPEEAIERLAAMGDLFQPVLALKQELEGTPKRPGALREYTAKRTFKKAPEPKAVAPLSAHCRWPKDSFGRIL